MLNFELNKENLRISTYNFIEDEKKIWIQPIRKSCIFYHTNLHLVCFVIIAIIRLEVTSVNN